MKKKVTAIVLCMCLLIVGVSWNALAENVQELVQGTEGIEPVKENIETEIVVETEELEKPEEPVEVEEQEEWSGFAKSVKPEQSTDSEKGTEIEEPVAKENGAEYTETAVISEEDAEIIDFGTWKGIDWSLDSNGKLVLDGSSEKYYLYNTPPWRVYWESIVSAEIRGSGWECAYGLFNGCSNLIEVDISNWDTSSVTNMGYLFGNCTGLTNLDLSGMETGNVTNMGGMFARCSNLRSLNVNGFNTKNVTDMSGMFIGCSNLTSLDVGGFDTGNVEFMGEIFRGCNSLMSIDVSNWDMSNVIEMGDMFSNCSSLISLDVDNWDTSSATNMGGMFSNCSSLISLDVSGLDTSSVTNMNWMFLDCSRVTNLDVSGFDTSNVTDMGSMFHGCNSLTYINVSSFDTKSVIEMRDMFAGCSNLESVDVSGFNTDRVASVVGMFDGCSGLQSLDLSSFDFQNVFLGDYMFTSCTNLTTVHTPRHLSVPVVLPSTEGNVWKLADGTVATELPQNLDTSVIITRVPGTDANDGQPEIITTTHDLNMEDVVRVKYVPYYYTLETDNTDEQNWVTFFLTEGKLPEGLHIYPATGEIYGMPLEAGDFPITVKASYSNTDYEPSFANLTVTVLDNTDNNVYNASDVGYEIKVPLGKETEAGSNIFEITESGDQLFVSEGEMREFVGLWLNGQKLEESKDYSAVSGSTRITIYGETLENKANSDGTNTIAAEFRIDGNPANSIRRTAQNFRLNLGGGTGNVGNTGGGNPTTIAKPDKNAADLGKDSQIAVGKTESATSIWQIVDAAGQPYQNITVELHSTPMVATADQRGIVVFRNVEGGGHKLTVKDRSNAVLASKSFELLFGDTFRIEGDRITVKNGSTFTVTAQVEDGIMTLLRIQEGDPYRVISPRTGDIENVGRFALQVLFCGIGVILCLYGKRRRNRMR